MSYWQSFLPLIRPQRGSLLIIIVLVVFSAIVSVLVPWPLKLLVDHVLSDKPFPESFAWLGQLLSESSTANSILMLVMAGLAIQFTQLIINLIKSVIETGVANNLTLGYGQKVFEHLQKMSLIYHGQNKNGDLVKRVTTDTRCIEEMVLGVALPLLTSLFTLVFMFLIMVNIHLGMTLIALFAAIPIPLLIKKLAPRMTEQTYSHQQFEGELFSVAEQTLSGLPVVQAFGQEGRQHNSFKLLSEGTMQAYLSAIKSQLQFSIGVSASTAVGTSFMMIVGGYAVLNGALTLGELLVFLSYVSALYGPVETLAYLSSVYATAAGRVKRVKEVLDQSPSVSSSPQAPSLSINDNAPAFSFQEVSFAYNPDEVVLKNVSLDVKAGEAVAFVGGTGSGKSTLVSLIPRFHNLASGRIKINGRDISELNLESLRANISIVLQDPFLLPITIAENIAYGRPGASEQEVIDAAITANAHEFIDKLPLGYQTILSEQAANLSGGQKQRIAIARALLKDAPVLILDEPTSALDARSESLFVEAIERLMKDRTTFIVAHRLSTIKNVDKIVVLDAGEIVEIGTEEELLGFDGYYSRLAA